MDAVIPRPVNLAIAQELVTPSTGMYDGAKVRLFSNNTTPTDRFALASLTELVMDGYTPGGYAIVWGAPYYAPDGTVRIPAPSREVVAGGGITDPATAYGYYVVGDPAGTPFLIAAAKFAAPVSFANPSDGTVVDINIPL